MGFTPELILCAACRPRDTPPASYCPPCTQALEAEIESYWVPLITTAQTELMNLQKEQERFETTFQLTQQALAEKKQGLESAGRKGSMLEMLAREVIERMYIHEDLKTEMEGRREDLEGHLRMHKRSYARELWSFRQSRAGVEEGVWF